jgi:hypothetical protein
MTQEQAKKIADLLHEIYRLKKYKDLFVDVNYRNSVHFEVVQHYGLEPKKVIIDSKFNPRFLRVLDQIIEELELELADM